MSDRALAINRSAKGGMLQSELALRFRRAFALFELQRTDEALTEMLDIEPKYSALFPNADLRADMLALVARALAHANRADEARVAARDALSIARDSNRLPAETTRMLARDHRGNACAAARDALAARRSADQRNGPAARGDRAVITSLYQWQTERSVRTMGVAPEQSAFDMYGQKPPSIA